VEQDSSVKSRSFSKNIKTVGIADKHLGKRSIQSKVGESVQKGGVEEDVRIGNDIHDEDISSSLHESLCKS